MKNLYYIIKQLFNKRSSQKDLLDFINNKKNLQKAVEGSMQKRIELFDRVNLHKKHTF